MEVPWHRITGSQCLCPLPALSAHHANPRAQNSLMRSFLMLLLWQSLAPPTPAKRHAAPTSAELTNRWEGDEAVQCPAFTNRNMSSFCLVIF